MGKSTDTISSKQLSKLIAEEVHCGHGFVPFVGSGMSAPSGILMGVEFGNFLAYCIYRVVGKKPRHNLPRDGWPKFPRDEEVNETTTWVMEEFSNLCREHVCEPILDEHKRVRSVAYNTSGNSTSHHLWSTRRPLIPLLIRSHNDDTWEHETQTRRFQEQFRNKLDWAVDAETKAFSRTSGRFVVESGIRSMHDWRSMLQFLARVQFDEGNRLTLKDTADNSVIDSFNVHITRDRQINLGQKMLAHLAGPLRIRTILTTNFDNLIETAFQKLLRPLSVVSVSSRGELPDPVTVRSKDSIVKLHGELSETRADFSLDDEPNQGEKETFARYIRGEFDKSAQTDPIANHMIVLGFSGQDVRIIQMMKYALDTRPEIKLFWICHGIHEPARIHKLFGKEYESRVLIHQTERADLFLYELYQNVTLSLPSGGFSYEFTHKVPPERVNNAKDRLFLAEQRIRSGRTGLDSAGYGTPDFLNDRKLLRRKIAEEVGERIVAHIQKPNEDCSYTCERLPAKNSIAEINTSQIVTSQASRPLILTNMKLYFTSGSATAMRVAFRRLLSQQYHCLWLELQDYPTPEGLIQAILRTISLRVGSYQLEHVVLFPDIQVDDTPADDTRAELLVHLKRLVKFLDVSPGKWVLFFYGRSIPGAASSWQNLPWTKKQLTKFEGYLEILCNAGFHCVYTPMTEKRLDKERLKIKSPKEELLSLKPAKHSSEDFQESYKKATKQRKAVAKVQDDAINEQIYGGPDSPEPSKASHLDIYGPLQKLLMENWIKPKAQQFSDETEDETKIELSRQAVVWYYRKMRFLYASTLFRQSRHTSAFFSDAVFPCPNKYNADGVDNDWVRSIEVNQWVDQLGSIDVFFYKPGGYSWKYRDMRLGLQNRLEAIPFAKINAEILKQIFANSGISTTEITNEVKGLSPLSYALQIRSRSHFEIASWYWKAFNATGHYLPFIETLYHYFECIENIDFARPISMRFSKDGSDVELKDDVLAYQITLFRSAMLSMIKCLRTGKPWVKFWLSGVHGHTMFEFKSLNDRLQKKQKALEENNPKIAKWSNELGMASKILKAELTRVQSSLQSEAGKYVPKPHRSIEMPDSRFDRFARAYERGERSRNSQIQTLDIASDTQVWQADFDSEFLSWLGHKLLNPSGNNRKVKPLESIGQAIKSVVDKDKDFNQATANKISRDIRKYKSIWVRENLHSANTFSGREKNGSKKEWGFDNSAAIFLVELISDFAYLIVKRAKMETACGIGEEKSAVATRKRWVQATMYCSLGLDLCKHLHPAYLQRERRQQIKLQTIYGLSLAHLGRPHEANRRFNEASAILSKESRTPDEVETAIIRIRRANASLLRAELIGDIIDALPSTKFTAGLEVQDKNKNEAKKEFVEFFDRVKKWKDATMDESTTTNLFCCIESGLFEKRKLRYILHQESGNSNRGNSISVDPIIRLVLDNWRDEYEGLSIDKSLDSLFETLSRMHSAMLDDAWVYIESAERLLAGYSQSSLWWGRVSALKLQAYAQVRADAKFESLVFRRKIQHDNKVVGLQRQLLLIAPSSAYQKMKCVRRGAEAMIAIHNQDFIPASSYSNESWSMLFSTLREAVWGILKNYCGKFDEILAGAETEFPKLLVQCLDRAEQSARLAYRTVNKEDLESDIEDLDTLPNSTALPRKVAQYIEHYNSFKRKEPNFDLVAKLIQRADLFQRIEKKLEVIC